MLNVCANGVVIAASAAGFTTSARTAAMAMAASRASALRGDVLLRRRCIVLPPGSRVHAKTRT
ncbi:hypothetical protein Sya03_14840 [Spirilliplanes yamanashiensis]|uniref:Uncharacterized protein n=1 Tax=Spirilliplanes yamanashiensis TaxID=42233 RepID=A0A8J3Y698_9ACTN|nr:hypothetical protein Sya03_14840 [Spirilliplanes yamanashiensis]